MLQSIKTIFKLAFLTLRNPRELVKQLTLTNIKLLFEYLRFGDQSNLDYMVKIYFDRPETSAGFKPRVFLDADSPKTVLLFERFSSPLVSIIIPAHNQWDYTYSCLQAILANTVSISYEVIIADDCSSDETRSLEDFVENVLVISNKENLGFLRTCNNAALHARGEYLLFLNNDTNVQQDWLQHLLELIERDEATGIVGAKLVYPDGRLQEAGGIIWRDGTGMNYGKFDDPERPEYNYVKDVDYVSGACLMIRKHLWERIGGFDERFVPAYYEDTDLAFAARREGYRVLYQPKAVVVHFEGVSCGVDLSSGIKAYQESNRHLFVEKNREALSSGQFDRGTGLFRARDRSMGRKTILVIDQFVPQYDKDAGSRSTFRYLQLFVDMGLKVVFIGDNFQHEEPYTSVLQQMGVEVLFGDRYENHWRDWIVNSSNFLDYVYLNRPRVSERYFDFIKANTKAKIIYQGHDLHGLRVRRRYELEGGSRLLKQAKRLEQIEGNLILKSDVVVTFSAAEQKIISSKWHKDAVVVPLFFYDMIPAVQKAPESRRDILFVGSFGLSANIDAILWFSREVLPIVRDRIAGIRFHVVGANPPEEISVLSSDSIIVHGYIDDTELKHLYEQVRLVVVPLRYGAGVKGKVLETIYFGVPLVATTIAVEGIPGIEEIVPPHDTADDFAEAICLLYSEDEEWQKAVGNYRMFLEERFSREHALEIMREVLSL